MVPPRKTPDRDSRYMGQALMISAGSKDPDTQVGAVIISRDHEPLGTGYNGPPPAIDDNDISWERPGKRDYVEHAEENAIDFSRGKLAGGTLYCTAFPCKKCMLKIVKKRIARVVYLERKYDSGSMQSDREAFEKSMEIARRGGVQVDVFAGDLTWIGGWVETLRVKGLLPQPWDT